MKCPDCGKDMWDNTEKKLNPKSPDFKCKDKACGKAIWINNKKPQVAPKPTQKSPTGLGGAKNGVAAHLNANGGVSGGRSDEVLNAILLELGKINAALQVIAKCERQEKIGKLPHEEENPFPPEF